LLGARGHLPDPVSLLLAEAEPEPGVDERRVGCGNEHVVTGASLLDPQCGGEGVEVANLLGLLLHCKTGELDPHVLAPDLRSAWSPDQVADQAAAAKRCGPGGAVRTPVALQLLASLRGCFVTLREERLHAPIACMARRQEPCRVVEVLVGEGDDFEPSHAT
jgi:hypothetical protein